MKKLAMLARIAALAIVALALPACHHGWWDNGNVAFYIDPVFGDDFRNDATPLFPFKTITRALHFCIPGDEIILATGTYSASSGEIFPILVKPGVLILGDPASSGTTTAIVGAGNYTIQGGTQMGQVVAAALVLGGGAQISGVTVTAGGATGVGVVCDGNSPLITSSTLSGCGALGLGVYRTASPTVLSTTVASNGAGGVRTFDTSSPVFRSCAITTNTGDGIRAEDTSAPNLGDATAAGSNTLTGNTGVGLNNDTTASTIQAVGNTWIASTQGADASGNYAVALTPGPVPAAGGNNFSITLATAAIQF